MALVGRDSLIRMICAPTPRGQRGERTLAHADERVLPGCMLPTCTDTLICVTFSPDLAEKWGILRGDGPPTSSLQAC
jgi:hypothetical protein